MPDRTRIGYFRCSLVGAAGGRVAEHELTVGAGHRGGERAADVAAARHGGEVIDIAQRVVMIERLQHTERKRGRPYSAAGERKTDAIEHLAVDADAVFGAQRRPAERLAALVNCVDFDADDVAEHYPGVACHGGALRRRRPTVASIPVLSHKLSGG